MIAGAGGGYGHGWLPAVLPAGSSRFRVADPGLAAALATAGAKLVESSPEVEIAPAAALRGDAPFAVVSIEPSLRPGPRAARVARRLASAGRSRVEAANARLALRRLGYSTVTTIAWDVTQPFRLPGAGGSESARRLVERLPQRSLVVGSRSGRVRTVLDEVLVQAAGAVGRPLEPEVPRARPGLLVVPAEGFVLRVAIGGGGSKIGRQVAALEALRAAGPPSIVAERIPGIVGAGSCGLADWSLERRLPGVPSSPRLAGPFFADCVDFLVELQLLASPRTASWWDDAAVVAGARPQLARAVRSVADRLDALLADVPCGFGHGDFFPGNLLVASGRLTGVIDWDGAGPGRLPLIDLLHLRHSADRVHRDEDWGPRLVRGLLPWVRAGGDGVLPEYCRRVGLELDAEQLEALVLAYWLAYAAYQLRTYAHRREHPRWLACNLDLVLDVVAGDTAGSCATHNGSLAARAVRRVGASRS